MMRERLTYFHGIRDGLILGLDALLDAHRKGAQVGRALNDLSERLDAASCRIAALEFQESPDTNTTTSVAHPQQGAVQ